MALRLSTPPPALAPAPGDCQGQLAPGACSGVTLSEIKHKFAGRSAPRRVALTSVSVQPVHLVSRQKLFGVGAAAPVCLDDRSGVKASDFCTADRHAELKRINLALLVMRKAALTDPGGCERIGPG